MRISKLTSRGPRPLATVGAALAGSALILSGCSAQQFSSAAQVDGEVITIIDIQDATAQFSEIAGQPVAPADLLALAIIGPELERIARANGVELPTQVAVETLEQMQSMAGTEAAVTDPHPLLVEIIRADLHVNAIVSSDPAFAANPPQSWLAAVNAVFALNDGGPQNVDLNPRFGEWDSELNTIVESSPEWIVTPDESDAIPEN